jgi:hypothetical protein
MNNILTLAPNAAHFVFTRWRSAWRAAATKAPARQRGMADELASVRALADSYRHTDPGFASDLYAAANRHELESEAASAR